MLHVILLILKIIGIVLASVIGLLLLIVAAVLFSPIRYRINAAQKIRPSTKPMQPSRGLVYFGELYLLMKNCG